MKNLLMQTLATLTAIVTANAQTTIDATNKFAYGANLGWINLAGNTTNGVVIGEYVCSGFAYSANCGWIHLGDGTPSNNIRYQNNSATDFGVNVTNYSCPAPGVHEADLRGFAYGANIGWINFEAVGDPRVDLLTGRLRGFAYGANVGWINLGEISANVNVTTTLAPGVDSEPDGIADAYEQTHAGNLTRMNATTDGDGDGLLDADEYLADTDPFDADDRLHVTLVKKGAGANTFDITFTTKPTRSYRMQVSPTLADGQWSAVGPRIKPAHLTQTATVMDPGGDTFHFWRATATLPLEP